MWQFTQACRCYSPSDDDVQSHRRSRVLTLGADTIALGNELIAMWVVAVAADDARLCHFALHEEPYT